jgi:hypothetical protein
MSTATLVTNIKPNTCDFSAATPVLESHLEAAISEYAVFWKLWPQFSVTHGQRTLVGFEIEFIGSHTSDSAHVNRVCAVCSMVRSALLTIASAVVNKAVRGSRAVVWGIESHETPVMSRSPLRERRLVSVTINIYSRHATGRGAAEGILTDVEECLDAWGIPAH